MKGLVKTLRVFYGFLTWSPGWFVAFFVLVILSSIEGYINPFFYKLFVDALPSGNFDIMLQILLILTFVRFIGLVVDVFKHLIGDYIHFQAAIDARRQVVKRIQDLDFAFHSTKSTGSLISAIKRGDAAFFNLYHAINFGIMDIIVGFVVILFTFRTLDPAISLIVFASFAITLALSRFLIGYNIKMRKIFNKAEDDVSRIIVDNMINYETVKLFAKERHELDRMTKSFKKWKSKLWGYANSFRLIDITVDILVNTTIFIVLFVGIRMFVDLRLSAGEFVFIVTFMSIFGAKLFDLMWRLRNVAKNYADISRYFEILDYKIQIKDPDDPVVLPRVKGEIKYEGVTFSYKEGRKNAISNLSLDIRQGQSVALVGRSGSGKTTLMKLLMRFYDIDKGKITIDGVEINKFTKSYLRSLMGVVPQEPIMFNNTIGYNIGYGKPEASQKEIVTAAKMANLHSLIQTLPKKYKTDVGERGIKLSGGQKQRLAIARMILSDPDIVIFDEATSQLDSENERMIQEAFWKAVKDKTTIIIAHRLSTAMRADKIVVLENGRIAEIGSHNALLNKKKSLYKYFWGLQMVVD